MSTPEVLPPALWGLVFGTAFVVLALVWWWAQRFTPKGIVRRLQRSGEVQVRWVSYSGLWVPAPGGTGHAPHGAIYDHGHALYTLNDQGQVELHFWPKSGPERHFAGRTPEEILKPTDFQAKRRKLTLRLLSAYGLILGVGFVVGFFLASGSAGSRWTAGVLGVIVAWIVIRVGLIAFAAVNTGRASSTRNDLKECP